MVKILFIPIAFNHVATIAMVRSEFEADLRDSVFAIALDERLGAQLKERRFPFKPLSDYKARNALDILKKESPDVVLAGDFEDLPRAFIFAANHLGIPSLFVNDGVTSEPEFEYSNRWYSPRRLALRRVLRWLKSEYRFTRFRNLMFTLRTLMAISSPVQALLKLRGEIDHRFPRPYPEGLRYAVAGQYAKEAYIAMGAEVEWVYITGQPRFDMVFKRKFSRDAVIAQLGIVRDKGIIVLATQPLGGSIWTETVHQQFVEMVVEAMAEFPDHQLVIKLHPSEDEEYYRRILTQMGREEAIVCRDIDLYQLLHACDLLIAAYSTVALEAMLFDKPVITINLSDKPDFVPYAKSGAAIGVYRKEDLIPAMKGALYNPKVRADLAEKRKKFVFEQAYKSDGQASKRVAELIAQLVREHKSEG